MHGLFILITLYYFVTFVSELLSKVVQAPKRAPWQAVRNLMGNWSWGTTLGGEQVGPVLCQGLRNVPASLSSSRSPASGGAGRCFPSYSHPQAPGEILISVLILEFLGKPLNWPKFGQVLPSRAPDVAKDAEPCDVNLLYFMDTVWGD